jgi:hypothetical protein
MFQRLHHVSLELRPPCSLLRTNPLCDPWHTYKCHRKRGPDSTLRRYTQSQLLYGWRFTANQFVFATSPLRSTHRIFISTEHLRLQSLCNILSVTIAAGSHQRSHSQVGVSRDSWPHFTVSDSRLPQPGEPGPCIYIPQEQGGPVITPGTGLTPFSLVKSKSHCDWRSVSQSASATTVI